MRECTKWDRLIAWYPEKVHETAKRLCLVGVLRPSLLINVALSIMRKFRNHDAMKIVKTWVNSWATSRRYHEPVILPCLFGQEAIGAP